MELIVNILVYAAQVHFESEIHAFLVKEKRPARRGHEDMSERVYKSG